MGQNLQLAGVQPEWLAEIKERTVFIQADFQKDDWTAVPAGFNLIVTLQAVKEVGFIKAREICPAADLSLMAAEKR